MEQALQDALAVILPELQRTGGLRPIIEERGDRVMFRNAEGHGQGIQLLGEDAPYQLALVADQVQEWAIEELWNRDRPATWPECPLHPNSHPLQPCVVAGAPSWRCPKTSETIGRIGELGS